MQTLAITRGVSYIDRIVEKYWKHIVYGWFKLDAECRFSFSPELCSMENYAYTVSQEIAVMEKLSLEQQKTLMQKIMDTITSYRAGCMTCKYFIDAEQTWRKTGIKLPLRKGYCKLNKWTVDKTIICRDYEPVEITQ